MINDDDFEKKVDKLLNFKHGESYADNLPYDDLRMELAPDLARRYRVQQAEIEKLRKVVIRMASGLTEE